VTVQQGRKLSRLFLDFVYQISNKGFGILTEISDADSRENLFVYPEGVTTPDSVGVPCARQVPSVNPPSQLFLVRFPSSSHWYPFFLCDAISLEGAPE
jgi:hypothetical protein